MVFFDWVSFVYRHCLWCLRLSLGFDPFFPGQWVPTQYPSPHWKYSFQALKKKNSQILNLFGVLRETIKGLSIQSLAYLGLRRFCCRCPFVFFVLFCFLLKSAIVSHHLLSQSGSYFKQIQAEVDPVRHSKMPVTSLRLKDKLLISSISMRAHVCLRER